MGWEGKKKLNRVKSRTQLKGKLEVGRKDTCRKKKLNRVKSRTQLRLWDGEGDFIWRGQDSGVSGGHWVYSRSSGDGKEGQE